MSAVHQRCLAVFRSFWRHSVVAAFVGCVIGLITGFSGCVPCTAAGCGDGGRLTWALLEQPQAVELCINEACTGSVAFESEDEAPAGSVAGAWVEFRWERSSMSNGPALRVHVTGRGRVDGGAPFRPMDGDVYRVTVITSSGERLEREHRVDYETLRPNGDFCPPVCETFDVTL